MRATHTSPASVSTQVLPAKLEVESLHHPFDVTLRLPGSKSLTNRALLLAAMAEGTSQLHGVLFSDDTRVMLKALEQLGFELMIDEANKSVTIQGAGGQIPVAEASLHLGNAGTAYRFLTAFCCMGRGTYTLDGIARMRERPIGELVDALRQLGAEIEYLGKEGYPPLRIHGKRLQGGELTFKPTSSSQYISAVMQIGPLCANGITLSFDGPITSLPYVRMTHALMQEFHVVPEDDIDWSQPVTQLHMTAGGYHSVVSAIEPDASNASYFLAAASLISGSRCVLKRLGTASLQGDAAFARKVLRPMGALVIEHDKQTSVSSQHDGILRGIDVDLNDMPDMAQTLAVLALFAKGPTVIRNVGNLRIKETDRMAALRNELTKFGANVRIEGDDLSIHPPSDQASLPRVIEVDTYDDHRMAMSFAVAGLNSRALPGRPRVVLNDPACVNKTFPDYFDYLAMLSG